MRYVQKGLISGHAPAFREPIAIYPMGVYNGGMDPKMKKALLVRLHRIEGQARGLQRMVEAEKYCVDVIAQAQAIKSALGAFEAMMLKNHLETHVANKMRYGEEKKAVEEMLKVYRVYQKKS